MHILLEASLSEPPSSIHCFRDVTLYASIFRKKETLVYCDKDTIDLYWHWLKSHGAMDFVEDIIEYGEEMGFVIGEGRGNIALDKLDEWSLPKVVSALSKI
tara:strand:+ start:26488 stop:26790 length:303 start_codon:yes stop_codon:yes gene_type:complete